MRKIVVCNCPNTSLVHSWIGFHESTCMAWDVGGVEWWATSRLLLNASIRCRSENEDLTEDLNTRNLIIACKCRLHFRDRLIYVCCVITKMSNNNCINILWPRLLISIISLIHWRKIPLFWVQLSSSSSSSFFYSSLIFKKITLFSIKSHFWSTLIFYGLYLNLT